MAGIVLGYGRYLRDVAATGNVVRRSGIGIAVSVAEGAGPALIATMSFANPEGRHRRHGSQENRHRRSDEGWAEQYAQLTLTGNRVS